MPWNLFLKGTGGKTTNFIQETEPMGVSVADFKNEVEAKTGIPPNEQRLLFGGHQLEDGKTLGDYKISEGATIYLVMRLLGGVERPSTPIHQVIDESVPRSMAECMIMGEEGDNVQMPCGHTISPVALFLHCRSEICASKKTEVRCCKCEEVWDMDMIRKYGGLSQKEFYLFQSWISQNFIMKDQLLSQCPGCQSICERYNPTDRCVSCRICTKKYGQTYNFCWDCKKKWIGSLQNKRCGNDKCETEEQLELLQNCPQTEIAYLNGFMAPSTRACPGCGTMIEHAGRCKHITCKVCKTAFCFVCLRLCIKGSWSCGSYSTACTVAPRQTIIPQRN